MSGILTNSAAAMLLAIVLDSILGDPQWLYHPVRIIGTCATAFEKVLRRWLPKHLRRAGIILTVSIVGGTFVLTQALCVGFSALSPWLGMLCNILGMYTAFALHSLSREGWEIRTLIKRGDLKTAKERVSLLVSRDMEREGEQGILRATLETLTENMSDGVIGPMLFAMLGGAPLALTYKAVNTLDSMIGYRNEHYRDFGWCAARLDDVVNLIPARITGALLVISAFLLGKHPFLAARAWWRDAQKGPSPNGGIPIVTFAGALDLRLGGNCWDKEGNQIVIPYVGGTRPMLTPNDIVWANIFLYLSTALFVGMYLVIIFCILKY
jgi:adenosylcobinamide-phosphate synthase